jgi:PKD repeat protein
MNLKNKLLIAAIAALCIFCSGFAQNNKVQNTNWVDMMLNQEVNFFETQKAFYQYVDDYKSTYRSTHNGNDPARVPGYKTFKRWEWFQLPRISQTGERFDPSKVWQEMNKYKQMYPLQAGTWTYIGNPTTPSGTGNGRLNFVRFDPNNSNTIYVGSPSGGLWKSTNGGQNWTTNTDNLPQVIGCTDLAIDPTNTQIMYLGTGDGDAGDNYTVGLLKSTDGGTTWNPTGLSFFVPQTRMLSKVLLNPNSTSTLLVATSAGIYRSTDAGTTFTLVQAGSFKDMEFKPGDPNTVYACGAQFYKSTNGGQTWTNITSGLPTPTQVSRMAIAVTPADPTYVYLLAANPATDYGFQGMYRSTNSGTSFSNRNTSSPSNILGWNSNGGDAGGQGWFDLALAVSPADANEIVTGGVNIWRSLNGGSTFTLNGHWTGSGAPYVHADIHELVYTSATTVFSANDGGLFRTTNNGTNWTDISNDLQISQIYGFGQSTTTANLLITGWQDNGTVRKDNTANWAEVMGGDGMLAFISSANNNNMWGSQYNGSLNRSTNGGNSWSGATSGITGTGAWVTPWKESPTTANTLYAGFQNMFRSTNGGTSWSALGTIPGTATITQFAVSPANVQVIWVAKGSDLYLTTNNGGTWTLIGNVPPGNISYIACHNTDVNKAWITYSGFTNSNKVFQTTDQGQTWTNLSGSIPNIPVNCITFMNGSNDGLYIGTDAGCFYKDGTMNVWQPFSGGLPNVGVTQIEVFYSGNKIRCSTYGRGMWESGYYTPGNYPPTANITASEFIACPGAGIQFTDYSSGQPTSWNWTFPGGSPASSTQQNPFVVYNASGNYNVTLIVTNNNGTDTISMNNYITIATSPNANPTTVGDSVCNNGVVNLSATGTGNGTLRWWDAAGGGNIVNTGATYSPSLTTTTTYYVDETFPSGNPGNVGPTTNGMGTGAMFSANDIRGLYFDVTSPIILNSIDVYCNSDGNRTIEIIDPQGNTYVDTTIFMFSNPSVLTTYTLNFKIYPGTGYFIKCRGLVDLYRNSAGAVYPYTSPSVNITNSNAGLPGYYYFFYNWQYTDIVCNTGRTPVTGTVYSCLSIDELFADGQFGVYPNPNNGNFEVFFNTGVKDNYKISITNVLGEAVYQETVNNFTGKYSSKLDFSQKAKGVYMLTISNGKNQSVKQVITF